MDFEKVAAFWGRHSLRGLVIAIAYGPIDKSAAAKAGTEGAQPVQPAAPPPPAVRGRWCGKCAVVLRTPARPHLASNGDVDAS